jgi:hypothetical protein
MPVITDKFKKQVLDDLLLDFKDSDNVRYYASIGRSEDWNDSDVPTVPLNSLRDARLTRGGIQSLKLIQDATYVIPRRTWVANLIYDAYDDADVGFPENPFYALNSNNEIYICLEQGKKQDGNTNLSTIQPTGNTEGTPFRTSDGYTWKFLYSIGALRADKFLSSAFMPVRFVTGTDSDSPAEDLQQEIVQNNAVKGQIVGYKVTNTGSGYTSAPTVSIVGNGTGATAYAVRAGETIIDIKVKADSAGNSGSSYFGTGYDYANVVLTGGGATASTTATVRPIFGQPNGIGSDPVVDLKATGMMFNSKPDGIEGGDFITGDEIFRQVVLLRNPRVDSAAGTLLSTTTARAVDKIITDGNSFVKSNVQKSTILGGTSGAQGIIDDTNDSSSVWYHQNETTGFTPFAVGESISVVGNASINGTIQSITDGEFNPFTGDLLYIDNRSAVTRSTDQTEDLKIVITI